jgi:hypothetical protein
MARQTFPTFSVLWKRHESLYIRIFIIALQILKNESFDKSSGEDTISEFLCPILNKVCYEEGKRRNCEIRTPDWEKPIQPVNNDELKGGKIRKRPDFTCKFMNPLACDADEHEIPLHIECKRLGEATSNNWKLNENYVVNGIMRFDSGEHEYGKRAPSGIMIGYIISMTPEQILSEINVYEEKYCSDNPSLVYEITNNKVWQYQHILLRKNIRPESFLLFHLWIDLRDS